MNKPQTAQGLASDKIQRVRGPGGLGDAIYLASAVRHLLLKGESLLVATKWPDVFSLLKKQYPERLFIDPSGTKTGHFDRIFHYQARKQLSGTTQFEDLCICGKITEKVEAKFEWEITNPFLVGSILDKADKKKILFVQVPRPPMDRLDGFGKELLPRHEVMDMILDHVKDRFFIVQCGKGEPIHHYRNIHLDLANQTTVKEFLDVSWVSDYFLGPCSNIVTMGEAYPRHHLIIWGAGVRKSHNPFIRSMSPQKVQHCLGKNGGWSHFAWDDWSNERILQAVDEAFI